MLQLFTTVEELVLCADSAAGPFKDIEDFYARGQFTQRQRFLVYKTDSLANILVPDEQSNYERASVAQVNEALLSLPDPDFVTKVILVDTCHSLSPWARQTQGADIVAESSVDGTIVLFQQTSADLKNTLIFEWCNLLRLYNCRLEEILPTLISLERFDDPTTGKQIADARMRWCVLGSLLISHTEEEVLPLCVKYPLLAAVFGKLLLDALQNVDESARKPHYDHFLRLANFIHISAGKLAAEKLKFGAEPDAAFLLNFLSEPI